MQAVFTLRVAMNKSDPCECEAFLVQIFITWELKHMLRWSILQGIEQMLVVKSYESAQWCLWEWEYQSRHTGSVWTPQGCVVCAHIGCADIQTTQSDKCVREGPACRITHLLQGGTSCYSRGGCNPPCWMGPIFYRWSLTVCLIG